METGATPVLHALPPQLGQIQMRLFAANLKFYEHGQIVVCGSIVPDPLQRPENPEHMNIAFRAGTGGLHSAEN
jgi:hypothetical protein